MVPTGASRRAMWHISIANMAMRAISLGGRFLLSIYIVHDLGLFAAGIFGIISGVAGFAPSLCGFGISYFINREIVTLAPDARYRLLRDRLCLNIVTAGAVWIAAWLCMACLHVSAPVHPVLIGLIITLEFLAFDLHLALINMRKPVTANFLLFIRSSSWIVPFILIGWWNRNLHSLQFLFLCWLIALTASFVMLAYVFRDADLRVLRRLPIDWAGLWRRARKSPLIYANDVASNGQVFLDRFIVLNFLGVIPTGLYTLYFSTTHGLYVLVATAITQLSMPKLVEAKLSGGAAGWRQAIVAEGWKAVGLASCVVFIALVMTLLFLPMIGFGGFTRDKTLFGLMALTALLKPVADLLNTGLYSLGIDRALALINLAAVLASVLLAIAGIGLFGLHGIGMSALATQLFLIAIRSMVLKRHFHPVTAAA